MPRSSLGAVACIFPLTFALLACVPEVPPAGLDLLAERYVKLTLAMDRLDAGYVDAYFGPQAWRKSAPRDYPTLSAIGGEAERLLGETRSTKSQDAVVERRRSALEKRVTALLARIDMLNGVLPFDEETRLLYDAVAPDYEDAHFQAVLDGIDALLPGEGDLRERSNAFRAQFVVPAERLAAVFDAAIAECRRRTLEHIALPEDERFTLEYVNGKPWSGYNWYRGNSVSLIQVNTDLPIHIDRAVDLGCHEGYPGHHTYHTLAEQALYRERGWIEFSVYALFSPQAPISEGAANYGIELAFPADERATFEKAVLFPIAGLDPQTADRYYRYLELREELSYARNEAARDYLDGRITRTEAVAWLERYGLTTAEEADKALAFIETYRGYVISYNLGRDVVGGFVERRAGEDRSQRWRVFAGLLSMPVSLSDLD